ncbi:hypothetical protein [Amycolatopsis sp. H20-H5]|uniref:hypothetical protein n=1 Tax=Amycolatopsis sp. H20-H5 TaxID=3046309 RepID=UPI002DB76AEF|nr:hypothetical protein [Amycolatopsis sp. H20-H5]MEC3976341.1 hypothetical protein [Amycolatopsis sp. H20-H5]
MNVSLVIIGAALVAAALLGGTRLGGGVIGSTAVKILLVLVGVISLLLGIFASTLSKPTASPAGRAATSIALRLRAGESEATVGNPRE